MKMRNIQTKSVGLFPLPMVILPKEIVRLHIFENKYKSLINDCFASGKDFIIPFVYNGKVTAYGTSVKLVDVERFYADGKMDIKVEGAEIVKITGSKTGKNAQYLVGDSELIDSSLPVIHKEELQNLYQKFKGFTQADSTQISENINLYEIAKNINLNKEVKVKLLKNASNKVIQSKIILNELRMAVLTSELQDSAGFRYYMN